MVKSIPVTLALAVLAASAAHADTLLLDGIEMNRPTGDMRPKQGTSMTAVESTHGAPAERHAAVGGSAQAQPPITRWDYASFSVYFEHDRVIHAVARRQ
jgi:hypothetical protein